MKFLILGGARHIGTHTATKLIDCGHDVVIADDRVTSDLADIPTKAVFYNGDFRDKSFLNYLMKKEFVDAVVYIADVSLAENNSVKQLKHYESNLCATKVLLDSMVDNGVDKIIFSTADEHENESAVTLQHENDETVPTISWRDTKVAMEKMIVWAAGVYDLHYVSLHHFNAREAFMSV